MGDVQRGRGGRRGFTLIELLVVVGIIAILIGLTLPAVQAARESARRARCLANLGQLARSVHTFETANGGFPPAVVLSNTVTIGRSTRATTYSFFCKLLPYLDQGTLLNNLNFDVIAAPDILARTINMTAAATQLDVFICPSESSPAALEFGPTSYRGNFGLLEKLGGPDPAILLNGLTKHGPFFPRPDGPSGVTSIARFTDGLSTSVLFSEKALGSDPDDPTGSGSLTGKPHSPFRDWAMHSMPDITVNSPDLWLVACSRLTEPRFFLDGGGSWLYWGLPYTLFSPVDTPNGRIPDCGNHNWGRFGLFTARSFHPGGVNAAMCDGSVRWVPATIQRQVWRALGTVDGGEVGVP